MCILLITILHYRLGVQLRGGIAMKVPIVLMRGGTSKGVFLQKEHLPSDVSQWTNFLLDLMGSPDHRQIDGLGGGNSLTSKVAIINKSNEYGIDLEYTFAQVSILQKTVDYKGNCGNISSAVASYAIHTGLISCTEPITKVRILNTNTNKIIEAEVEVQEGKVVTEGNIEIPGVPGTGSPIYLTFQAGEGAVTKKLYPTGRPIDRINIDHHQLDISIVDYANPLVYVNAEDIGLKGTELPHEITEEVLQLCEKIRGKAAEMCGLCKAEEAKVKSPAVPKLTIVSQPRDYIDSYGRFHKGDSMDIQIRMLSMQQPHGALAITGAICTSAAIFLGDTILNRFVVCKDEVIRLAHPGGIMQTKLVIANNKIQGIKVIRTARVLLSGVAYTKNNYEQFNYRKTV